MSHLWLLFQLRPFRNAYLRRGLAVWIGLRLALAFGGVSDPGVPTEFGIFAGVGLAVWVDARRRSEDLFLANLGIPGWAIAVLSTSLPFVLELLLP